MDPWHSDALEVLQPLRWHMNELIISMEGHNRWAKLAKEPMLPEAKIAAAKEALQKAEEFFTKGK